LGSLASHDKYILISLAGKALGGLGGKEGHLGLFKAREHGKHKAAGTRAGSRHNVGVFGEKPFRYLPGNVRRRLVVIKKTFQFPAAEGLDTASRVDLLYRKLGAVPVENTLIRIASGKGENHTDLDCLSGA